MNITKEELKLLLEVESYLWNNNTSMELYLKIHNLNSKLLEQREERNKKVAKDIAFKKKTK